MLERHKRYCKICKVELKGRRDKIFCSPNCKSYYHSQLSKATDKATARVDKILHRNRSILLEIMGKNKKQKKVSRSVIEDKNFKVDFCTGVYFNNQGKMYRIVYDFAWMEFSDGEILIIRRG